MMDRPVSQSNGVSLGTALHHQELGTPSRKSRMVVITPRRVWNRFGRVLSRGRVTRTIRLSFQQKRENLKEAEIQEESSESSFGNSLRHGSIHAASEIDLSQGCLGSPTTGQPIKPITPRRGIHHFSQILSNPGSRHIHDKFNRLVDAIGVGHWIHFTPKGRSSNHRGFAVGLSRRVDSPESHLEREIATWPNNFGQIIQPSLSPPESQEDECDRQVADSPWPYPRIITSGSHRPLSNVSHLRLDRYPRLTVRVVETDDSPEEYGNIEDEAKSSIEEDFDEGAGVGALSTWEDAVAGADEMYNIRYEGSNRQYIVVRGYRQRGSVQESQEELSPTNQEQASPLLDSVAPIPCNFHKSQGMRTPSIHSHGTSVDCSSPLFPNFVEAVLRQAQSGPNFQNTHNHPKSFLKEQSHIQFVPNESVVKWLGQVISHDHERSINHPYSKSQGQAPDTFDDAQITGSMGSSSEGSISLTNDHRRVPNFYAPSYLQYNSFYLEREAATAAKHDIITTEEVSNAPRRCQIYEPSDQNMVEYWPRTLALRKLFGIESFCSAPCRLERRGNDRSLASPSSSSSKESVDVDENASDSSSRAANRAFALARLEGRVSSMAPTPIERFVDCTWKYGNRVHVEDQGPRLLRPTLLVHYNMKKVMTQSEAKIKELVEADSEISDRDSASIDDDTALRPARPAPRKAQRRPGGTWPKLQNTKAESP